MKELNTSKKLEMTPSANGTTTPTITTEEVDREGSVITKAALTIAELGAVLPPNHNNPLIT
jgi:hypothetical protein